MTAQLRMRWYGVLVDNIQECRDLTGSSGIVFYLAGLDAIGALLQDGARQRQVAWEAFADEMLDLRYDDDYIAVSDITRLRARGPRRAT